MKAAVVREFKRPLVIEDRPVPEPGDGQVLVKIEASGLCHTDMHAANGDWPVKPTLPFVPGHEGVGIVQRVGRGVTRVAEGDRVAIPWLGWACGECEYCMTGWETLCEQQQNSGYSVERRLGRVRPRLRRLRGQGAQRDGPVRGRAPHLRRRHHL